MVNISSVSRLAGKALTVLKPTTRKVTSTLIFGVGAGVGYLAGQNNSQKVVSPQTTEQVVDSTATKPKQEQGEKEFTYVPPKIGEDGIVKADTSYYAGTKQPEYIGYKDENGDPVQVTKFDKNGKMEKFHKYVKTIGDERERQEYNAKGDLVEIFTSYPNGSLKTISHKDEISGMWKDVNYDKDGRMTHREFIISNHVECEDMTYHKDGSRTEKSSYCKTAETFDRNNRLIKKKQYDDNGVLKYTVVPKYNKDGDVIKNDTIRNNQ